MQTHKFFNDAPVAPDLLFEVEESEDRVVVNSSQRYEYKPAPPKRSFTAFQYRVARMLWYLRQVSSVPLNDRDMKIYKEEKLICIARCIEIGRVHMDDIRQLIEVAEKHTAQSVYLIGTKNIDRPAFKLAKASGIRFIPITKLETLERRIVD